MASPDDDPIQYWKLGKPEQNFGDFLSELFLERVFAGVRVQADAYNLIGSVISAWHLLSALKAVRGDPSEGTVAFWGCGARDRNAMPDQRAAQFKYLGVRGPLTRDVLGLPPDTVLGDPGLIVPLVHPRGVNPPGQPARALCVPHFLDPRTDADLQEASGADHLIRARIAPTLDALTGLIDQISQARFVLAGALHAAIVACAYRVPFAYFDSGFIDTPFKWDDFSASVGIETRFAKDLAEGEAIYADRLAPAIRLPKLAPILRSAPFFIRPGVMLRALQWDGDLPGNDVSTLELAPGDCGDQSDRDAQAQREWRTYRMTQSARIRRMEAEAGALRKQLDSLRAETAAAPAEKPSVPVSVPLVSPQDEPAHRQGKLPPQTGPAPASWFRRLLNRRRD